LDPASPKTHLPLAFFAQHSTLWTEKCLERHYPIRLTIPIQYLLAETHLYILRNRSGQIIIDDNVIVLQIVHFLKLLE